MNIIVCLSPIGITMSAKILIKKYFEIIKKSCVEFKKLNRYILI